jgi:hypothetical protein
MEANLAAGEVCSQIEVMHAHVEKRTDFTRPRWPHPTEIDGHGRVVAEKAVESPHDGIETLGVTHEQATWASRCEVRQKHRFRSATTQRFLYENVSTCGEGTHGASEMGLRRRCDDQKLRLGDRLGLALEPRSGGGSRDLRVRSDVKGAYDTESRWQS